LATLSGDRSASAEERRAGASTFGKAMFDSVIRDDVATAYDESIKVAVASNENLRIRLVLDRAGNIAGLPWEFLHDGQDFLTMSRSTPIVRYPRQTVQRRRLELHLPLRILVMIANPVDMPPLNVAEERVLLERATAKLRGAGMLELDFLEDSTLQNLQRKLREKEYHIFHYVGHSGYDDTTGIGWLSLEDRIGEKSHEPVEAEFLARELSEENSIRLVVLNSCHGARQNELNPAGGIASSLVARGIPAVVANQFEISNEAAAIFAEEFYTSVTESLPVDEATAEGRRAVAGALNNTEWATPVLYLRAVDGKLFDIAGIRRRLRDRERWLVAGASVLVAILVIVFIFNILGGDDGNGGTATPSETDLDITEMNVSSSRPAPGEVVFMEISIQNQGPGRSALARLEFLGDDQDGRTLQIVSIPPLNVGDTHIERLPYQFNWFGSFISQAHLDPDADLNDPDRRNNISFVPIITNRNERFVIDFSDALPGGQRITESRVVEAGTFDLWGFELGVVTVTPGCEQAVLWFKVQPDNIRTVAVGTGLPDDPNSCAAETLTITLLEQRDPTNEGTSAIVATFYPSLAFNTLTGYIDRDRTRRFAFEQVTGDNQNFQVAELELGLFDRNNMFSADITSDNGEPVLVSSIAFGAP
ncbi:MAG: CHAT domain-containing protein, partial [Chloroflexi bacterium]|nr:CHAT domain-containing protein [Chloroflexota bacterium]